MKNEEKYLTELNPKQREAVLETDGPLLIVAGAGAGKTKTLTHRILHLIKKGVEPRQILAITFTNKAAKEMEERVFKLIDEDRNLNLPIKEFEKPRVSTFHSLGVQILREQSAKIDIPKFFSIYDRDDSKRAVKSALKKLGYDPKEYEPNKILSIISREKGNFKTQEEYEAGGTGDFFTNLISSVWREYEKILKKEKSLDFDDLLLKTALLLKKSKEIREYYQKRWQYIHIDEYQDTNEVQYQIAKILASSHQNICVVGDADQNIYSWRGATIKNIMDFEKDYPSATEILLEENYRSTKTILDVANTIIEKNEVRRPKNLFTKNHPGEKISLYNAFDENDEAYFASTTCAGLIDKGVKPREIAVLYRANFQSRVLEESFLSHDIPYQVLGTRFFDRKEIKDILSYIKSALNPDDLNSLGRIINVPTRGIGKVTFLKIAEGREKDLTGKIAEKVFDFRKLLADIKAEIESSTPSEVIKFILINSGLKENFEKGGDEGLERLENVKELASLAKKYDGLEGTEGIEKLLEDAALATDQDSLQKDNGGVKLMTVHASKGLEYDYVFVTGLEEGLFPHERINEKKEDTEEERRLFYVALTRARQKIFLTYASVRTIFGREQVNVPSEFIYDIPDEHIESHEYEGGDISDQVKEIFIDF